jgi:putative cofactor-binding repeat protein
MILALLTSLRVVRAASVLFVMPTTFDTDCTRLKPCTLVTALNEAVDGDTLYLRFGTYTGAGGAVITLTKSITLYGSWDGSNIGPIKRDLVNYPSILNGEGQRRVIYITGTVAPTVDGFVVTRGNAAGQTASCPSIHGAAAGCGGGIFVYGAQPVIANNVITNNVAAATAAGTTAYGGGLYLAYANGAVITGNIIISNAGSGVSQGHTGGLLLNYSNARVQHNQILNNHATLAVTTGWGGGLSSIYSAPTVQTNTVRGNWINASTGAAYSGAGLHLFNDSGSYSNNQLTENHGGNVIYVSRGQPHFAGNQVVSNSTSIGLEVFTGPGGATLVNNIIARSGSTTIRVQGFPAQPVTATLLHNTLVGPGGGYGIYAASYSTVWLTNTIVVSHTMGITNVSPLSATVMADHILFWANTNAGLRGTDPVDGDPRFVDPAAYDYHLGASSAAIDQGIAADVATDLDGDQRPFGTQPDIGADEAVWLRLYLPLVLRST